MRHFIMSLTSHLSFPPQRESIPRLVRWNCCGTVLLRDRKPRDPFRSTMDSRCGGNHKYWMRCKMRMCESTLKLIATQRGRRQP